MTTKQKIIKEIENIPDQFLEQVHQFLNSLKAKKNIYKNITEDSEQWNELIAGKFLEGYGKSDAVYDNL